MQLLTVVMLYLSIGVAISAALGWGLLIIDGLFYSFCWVLGKVDNYIQDQHWKKIQKFPQPPKSYSKVV